MSKLLIGADPEFFPKRPIVTGLPPGVIKGTKKKPEPTKYGAIQIDGLAIEINITPADNAISFNQSIQQGIKDVEQRSGPLYKKCVYYFENIKKYSKRFTEMGCDPDLHGWLQGQSNFIPDPAILYRAAGGHVHIGWTEADPTDPSHIEECCSLVQELDSFVGLWCVGIEGYQGSLRRSMYGGAGAFRPKPYGLEYRVPANTWCWQDCEEMFNRTKAAFLNWEEGDGLTKQFGTLAAEVIDRHKTLPDAKPIQTKVQEILKHVA